MEFWRLALCITLSLFSTQSFPQEREPKPRTRLDSFYDAFREERQKLYEPILKTPKDLADYLARNSDAKKLDAVFNLLDMSFVLGRLDQLNSGNKLTEPERDALKAVRKSFADRIVARTKVLYAPVRGGESVGNPALALLLEEIAKRNWDTNLLLGLDAILNEVDRARGCETAEKKDQHKE